MLVAVVPFLINLCYINNKGISTVWGGQDLLSFYGTILSFLGSVALGAVAIYQNKKAFDTNKEEHNLNLQLAKLQQAQFVSMFSIEEAGFYNLDIENNNKLTDRIVIDLIEKQKGNAITLGFKLENKSNYPIVQICIGFGFKQYKPIAIYIAPGEKTSFSIMLPSEFKEVYKIGNEKYSKVKVEFTNIFDFHTRGTFFIENPITQDHKLCDFRFAKFTDVNPNNMAQISNK